MSDVTREHRGKRRHLLGLLILLSVAAANCGLCGDEVVMEVVSPDARYVARSFVRSCGATTPYVTHVELRRNRYWLTSAANIYVATGHYELSLVWDGPAELRIAWEGCPDRHPAAAEWNGVTITIGLAERGGQRPGVEMDRDEPQNHQMQLTAPAQAIERRS
jgi:hypothetical protein